jgi:hypothetical protein
LAGCRAGPKTLPRGLGCGSPTVLDRHDAAFVVGDQAFEGREAVMAFLSTCLPDDHGGKHMNPQTLIQLAAMPVSSATMLSGG